MKVILAALSAKHVHKTLAPWCLKAYIDSHQTDCAVVVSEHTINDLPEQIVASLYRQKPDVIGFACYIWNITMVNSVATALRKLLPDCVIVLGGPEVSFEKDFSAFPFANAIIAGAGEAPFLDVVRRALAGERIENELLWEHEHIPFASLPSPYTKAYFASMQDPASRLVYYESTRGCPFRCAYCLSALSGEVESLPLERVYQDMDCFVLNGVQCVKFVDRTFNYDRKRAAAILEYVKALDTTCTFHFEVAPDLFDDAIMTLLKTMPVGRVQFEMGIQSTHDQTLNACSRKTDLHKAFQCIAALSSLNTIHIHVDLIAGLPYETLETFKSAVNLCLMARPHMLQLGFLKLLKGSVLRQQQDAYGMQAWDEPPYEVLCTDTMSYGQLQQLKAVEDAIDKYYNSGLFASSVTYGMTQLFETPFAFFEALATFIGDMRKAKAGLREAYQLLYDFLLESGGTEAAAHYIMLDCISHDLKALLPNGLNRIRDREEEFLFQHEKQMPLRIAYFPYDRTTRVYLTSVRDPITKAFELIKERKYEQNESTPC